MDRSLCFGKFMAALLALTATVFGVACANEAGDQRPGADDLAAWVGEWQTFEDGDDIEYGQKWVLDWSPGRTHLTLAVETTIDNALAFTGSGYVLFDPDSETQQIYLMMNNGAMHLSTGEKTGENTHAFKILTFGVPDSVFPDGVFRTRILADEIVIEDGTLTEDGAADYSDPSEMKVHRVK